MQYKQKFIDALVQAHDMLPGNPITDAGISMFCSVLEANKMDYGTACVCLAKHLSDPVNGKFPPVPAHIFAQLDIGDDSQSGWIDVLKAKRSKKSVYRPVVFEDKQIHVAIAAMGGWQTLYDRIAHCMYEGEGLEWVKKDFIESYKTCRQKVNYDYMVAHDSAYKYDPLIIGNADQCQAHLLEHKKVKSKAITAPMKEAKRIASGKVAR